MVDLFSDIIQRCRQGDRTAQEAVYNLLAGKMYAVCLRYCSNYEEAKDLLHDGFVTIFTKIDQFKSSGSFEGWARKIFVNHAIELYRKKTKFTTVDCLDQLTDIEDDNVNHEEESGCNLTEADLLAMIDELPNQYKVVFNMYVVDGLSHKDIAQKLGISEGTSRSNLLRARGIMQKKVKSKIYFDVVSNASK